MDLGCGWLLLERPRIKLGLRLVISVSNTSRFWWNILRKKSSGFGDWFSCEFFTSNFIVLDAFTGEYIPEHMLTQEFLEEVKQVMTPDGVLISNTFSTSNLYAHESETYRAVFGEFFNLKMSGSGNRVIIAQQKALPDQGQLKVNAQPLYEPLKPYGVEILEFPARMGTRPDWDQTRRVLTDQFSPANLLGQ